MMRNARNDDHASCECIYESAIHVRDVCEGMMHIMRIYAGQLSEHHLDQLHDAMHLLRHQSILLDQMVSDFTTKN